MKKIISNSFRALLCVLFLWLVSLSLSRGPDTETTIVDGRRALEEVKVMDTIKRDIQKYQHDSSINQEIEKEMAERVEVMRSACARFGLDNAGLKPNPWEYIVDRDYGLAWCNIFKSASSSWMYIFNLLAGYSTRYLNRTKKPLLQLARDHYGRPTLSDLLQTIAAKDTISFIIGRNPMERLISAYRDKIQLARHRSPHDKLRREITQKYRNVNVPKQGLLNPRFIPTFKEFCLYLIDEAKGGAEPDMHWAPAYHFCTPCHFNLSTVVLFETQDRDTKYILQRAGLADSVDLQWRNPTKGGQRTSDLTLEFISQLPEAVYMDIVRLYEIDFAIFGYKPPEWSEVMRQVERSSLR